MRLPLAIPLDARDGLTDQDGRMTNVVAEVYEDKTFVLPRPALALLADQTSGGLTVGQAYNVVCSPTNGGELLSIYQSSEDPTEAFLYGLGTQELPPGGPVSLGTLGGTFSSAYGCSSDGSVVVGMAYNGSSQPRAFRWTSGGGMVDLGTLGGTASEAYGCSDDGSVVVGYARNGSSQLRAFRWTQAGGMVELSGLSGATTGAARGSSSAGGTVVGYSGNFAVIWPSTGSIAALIPNATPLTAGTFDFA